MKTPHKHAELIKAWAYGAEIQWFDEYDQQWWDVVTPSWKEKVKFRIKPEPKPDIEFLTHVQWDIGWRWINTTSTKQHNLKMTFDAETGKLKSAEVI